MTVRKFLELSTAHVPRHLGDPAEVEGIIVDNVAYGWLMWVPDDPEESSNGQETPTPAEYLNIQIYARSLGCDRVLFDSDVDEYSDLPQWKW